MSVDDYRDGESAAKIFEDQQRPTIFCGYDYGVGQAPDNYDAGYRTGEQWGLVKGALWTIAVEVVIAAVALLIVKLV